MQHLSMIGVPLLLLSSLLVWTSYAGTCLDTFTSISSIILPGESGDDNGHPLGTAVFVPTGFLYPTTYVKVKLNEFTTANPQSLRIFVEAPTGEKVLLMRQDSNSHFVSAQNIEFTSNSTTAIPSGNLVSGVYTNHKVLSETPDFFVNMTDLVGITATGVWRLWVEGDVSSVLVSIQSWSLTIITSCTFPSLSPPAIVKCYRLSQLMGATEIITQGTTTDATTLTLIDGLIYDISVHINDLFIQNPRAVDISLSLGGTTVHLLHNITTSFAGDLEFDISFADGHDTFPVSINTPGTYRPSSVFPDDNTELSLFKGMDPNDEWTVEIVSWIESDNGITFTSFSVNFTTDCGSHAAPILDCEAEVEYEISACGVDVETFTGYFSNSFNSTVEVVYDLEAPVTFYIGTTEIEVTARNYWGSDSCLVDAVVFTPGDIAPCGSNGTCEDSDCVCAEGYSGAFCCAITGDEEEVCGGSEMGVCALGGLCECETGFGGERCCPQSVGQGTACGPHGTCLNTSDCTCEEGYVNPSCNVDARCPSDDDEEECSAHGTCESLDFAECLTLGMRFIDNASTTFSIGGTVFTDEGRVALIQSAIEEFSLGDSEDAELVEQFYLCTDPTARQQCIKQVILNIANSDLLYDSLTEEDYPEADPDLVHDDLGIYLAVSQAVHSFLSSSSEPLIAALIAQGGDNCDNYLIDNEDDTRQDCLFYFIAVVSVSSQSNSAHTHYLNSGSINATVGESTFADEGKAQLIQQFAYVFYDMDPRNQTLLDFYMEEVGDCDLYDTREECLVSLFTIMTTSVDWLGAIQPYGMNLDKFLNDSAHRAVPDVPLPFTAIQLQESGILLLSGSEEETVFIAVMLVCYPWLAQQHDLLNFDPDVWPLHHCDCATDIVDYTSEVSGEYALVYSGASCSSLCPRGLDDVPCSGFSYGTFRGQCIADDEEAGHCVCAEGWGGLACNFFTHDACIRWNDTVECSGPTHGACVQTTPAESDFECQCVNGWGGVYCEFADCPTDDDGVCAGNGVCEQHGADTAPRCHCFVTAYLAESDSIDILPFLPTGEGCNVNGSEECAVFFVNGLDTDLGVWVDCSLQGTCTNNGSVTYCECVDGYYGDKCQFTSCPESVCPGDGRSFCNANTTECECNARWATSEGCVDDSCVCGDSLCEHGHPDAETGTECECDSSWEKDLNGTCTIPICPFIMFTGHGERVCDDNDPRCEEDQDSLLNQCCIQACPNCQYNDTSSEFYCPCDPPAAYSQSGGVCYTICHEQPYTLSEDELSVECNCSALTGVNSVWDEMCHIHACLNGGTANEDHSECECVSPFSGTFCQVADCGDRGDANTELGICDCFPPFYRPLVSTRLSCLIDNVVAFILGDSFTEGVSSFVDDPNDSEVVRGVNYTNEQFVSIAQQLVDVFGIGGSVEDLTVVPLDSITLGPNVDTFNTETVVKLMAETACYHNPDLLGTCAQRMAISATIPYILGFCPGARCGQLVSSLAIQRTCPLVGTPGLLSRCLLDGSNNLLFTLLAPTSPFTDNPNVLVDITGEEDVVADEGQAIFILDLFTSFTSMSETELEIVTRFYDDSYPDHDGPIRTAKIGETLIRILNDTAFTDELESGFPDLPGVSVTVNSVPYSDEGKVAVIQTADTACGVGMGSSASVPFFSLLCESLSSLDCKKQTILLSCFCKNKGLCPGSSCQSCITSLATTQNIGTLFSSNTPLDTESVSLHLSSDAAIALPTPAGYPFFSTPREDDPDVILTISGTHFTDESQAFLIRSLIDIFQAGNSSNATFLALQMSVCPTEAEEVERSALCEADNANGGQIILKSSPGSPFSVSCLSHQLAELHNQSCGVLDCTNPTDFDLCATCVNGEAYVEDNQLKCDCSGTIYSGDTCEDIVCLHGGERTSSLTHPCLCLLPWSDLICNVSLCQNGGFAVTLPGDGGMLCNCPFFPYTSGDFCEVDECDHGTPNTILNKCDCDTGFTGAYCDIPLLGGGVSSSSSTAGTVIASSSSTASAGNTSSSSTAETNITVVVSPVDTTTKQNVVIGVIAGAAAVGTISVTLILILARSTSSAI